MLIELRTACEAVCYRCARGHPRETSFDGSHQVHPGITGGDRYGRAERCQANALLELANHEALQGRQVVAKAEMRGEMEEVCALPSGGTLYREANGAGGHSYWSDAIGGGVLVWDTSFIPEDVLLAAMAEEHRRRMAEQRAKREAGE